MSGNLDVVVSRCLSKDPADRYASAAELSQALKDAADEPVRAATSPSADSREQLGNTATGLLSFELASVQRIPPPARSPLFVTPVVLLVGVGVVLLAMLLAQKELSEHPYRLSRYDLLDAERLVSQLMDDENRFAREVRSRLPVETRMSIGTPSAADSDDLAHEVRAGLNELLSKDQLLLDIELAAEVFSGTGIEELTIEDSEDRDLGLANRRLVERIFEGSFRRYRSGGSGLARLSRIMKTLLQSRGKTALLALWFAFYAGGLYLLVLSFSWSSLRLSFGDVADVERLLDYFVSDMGFRRPLRDGDNLIFKAKLWTFLVWNVVRLRAKVDGGVVVLTGSRVMLHRLEKRLLAHRSAAQDHMT
jgi:hypothetical protein